MSQKVRYPTLIADLNWKEVKLSQFFGRYLLLNKFAQKDVFQIGYSID